MVLELVPKANIYTEIKHYSPIILAHTTLKGVQIGLVGGCLVGLIIAGIQKLWRKKQKKFRFKTIIRSMNNGMIFGTILVNGLAIYRIVKRDTKFNQSRAFRIERNRNQNIVDNFCVIGMFVGEIILTIFKTEDLRKEKFAGGVIGGLFGLLLSKLFLYK